MQISESIHRLTAEFEAAGLHYGHGTDNAWDEAVYLVFESLNLDYDCADEALQVELTAQQEKLIFSRGQRRIQERVPVAYLTGAAWFGGLRFKSDERALIPRSPFAEAIRNEFQPLLPQSPRSILDLCCGGGCIGLLCALQFPRAKVDLADISQDALNLAAENSRLYQLDNKVSLIKSDLFAQISPPQHCYDLIVSNPPYVSTDEINSLPAEFAQEPVLGLYSADQGLDIPLRILAQAADYLSEKGVLILEVGASAENLQRRLPKLPFLWLEFEHGGDGVFALSREQLLGHQASILAALMG